MARFIYSLLLYLLSPLVFIHLWLRGKKAPEYRKRLSERLGFYAQKATTQSVVFHCASLGEVIAATPMIKKLQQQQELNIVLTCNTPTGSAQIKKTFGDTVKHVYLPLDFCGAVARFLTHFKPNVLIILETELWPNLITTAKKRNIPVLLLNARLSEKSMRGYQNVKPLTHAILSGISHIAAHNQTDAERFVALCYPQSQLTIPGSIKFDVSLSASTCDHANSFRQSLGPRPFIWIAGSTHEGEDAQLLDAHQQLCCSIPNALLILVPRHPERFDTVADLVHQRSFKLSRKSHHPSSSQLTTCQVLLGDTLGELSTLYGGADTAFIGGSLIERGGHNPLEAAAFGIAVLTGPHTFNFNDVYQGMFANQACKLVTNSHNLADTLLVLANNPAQTKKMGQAALHFVKQNQGAVDHCITLISHYLD